MLTLLRTLSAGYFGQHRARTVLVVLSIALGVATLVATQALSRGLASGIQEGVNPLASLGDLLVVNGQTGVPADLSDRLREANIAGVADLRALVVARVALVEPKNRAVWLFGIEARDDQPPQMLSGDNPL